MRSIIAFITAFLVLISPALAAPARMGETSSSAEILAWINGYRGKPAPDDVPAAVLRLSRLGMFKDPESSGVYIGFMAGILGSNPERAERMIGRMLAMPPEDHWALVRAIAYSGHPEWRTLLLTFRERMPARKVMIARFVDGKLPTLEQLASNKDEALIEKVRAYFTWKKYFGDKDAHARPPVLEPSPDLLDTLWGYYFATGAERPVARIVGFLPLSKDRDSVEKLTIGSMAKYTLATNASRDFALLALLKNSAKQQPKEVSSILTEVIEAAETVETGRLRKDALAAVDELRRKGPGYKRNVS
ncbi:MAG TPA: hypothetical protein VGD13_12415, partial [Xanthobacteraceae bacterium]